jgi:hypothetical protein
MFDSQSCLFGDYSVHKIIPLLSFKEYVLIDCLKFNNFKHSGHVYLSYLNSLDIIALTKQGFLNIFNEVIALVVSEMWLFDNLIIIYARGIKFNIRFASELENKLNDEIKSEKLIKKLINLPALDFYKRTLRVL